MSLYWSSIQQTCSVHTYNSNERQAICNIKSNNLRQQYGPFLSTHQATAKNAKLFCLCVSWCNVFEGKHVCWERCFFNVSRFIDCVNNLRLSSFLAWRFVTTVIRHNKIVWNSAWSAVGLGTVKRKDQYLFKQENLRWTHKKYIIIIMKRSENTSILLVGDNIEMKSIVKLINADVGLQHREFFFLD